MRFGLVTQFYASGSSALEYFWVFYDSLSQTDTLYATNEQTTEFGIWAFTTSLEHYQ